MHFILKANKDNSETINLQFFALTQQYRSSRGCMQLGVTQHLCSLIQPSSSSSACGISAGRRRLLTAQNQRRCIFIDRFSFHMHCHDVAAASLYISLHSWHTNKSRSRMEETGAAAQAIELPESLGFADLDRWGVQLRYFFNPTRQVTPARYRHTPPSVGFSWGAKKWLRCPQADGCAERLRSCGGVTSADSTSGTRWRFNIKHESLFGRYNCQKNMVLVDQLFDRDGFLFSSAEYIIPVTHIDCTEPTQWQEWENVVTK